MRIIPPSFPQKVKVIIGSTNPVKINAVKKAFIKVYPNAEFQGISVSSLVSIQPKSSQESRTGAYNRAKNVLESTTADFAVGLEGGIDDTEIGMMTNAWCCIIERRTATISYGGGMNFHLPEIVAQKIRKGGELGPIMDELIHENNWKEKGGAIEIFTSGLLSRTKAYTRLVEMALTKFVASKYYL